MALGVSSACGTGLDPYCVSVATQTKDFFSMNSGDSYFFLLFFPFCFSGCAGVLQLRSLHGRVLLQDVQVLRRRCEIFFSDATIGRLFRLIIWLVVDGMMLFCRLTRSTTIAKTAASAGASPVST